MTLLARSSDSGFVRSGIQRLAEDQERTCRSVAAIVGRYRVGSIAGFRSTMQVFLGFAGTAILLAAVGIYGLMSYWVSQRTYEIGLRVAMGATRRGVLAMILTQGLKVTLYGVAGGIVAALLLTRFLAALLYGVAATDVLTFAMVIALVLGVAIVATAVPAWRAARIDPLKSLRAE
jgi:ABC-type antimicrobial peptide transport system permease subunit